MREISGFVEWGVGEKGVGLTVKVECAECNGGGWGKLSGGVMVAKQIMDNNI